MNLPKDYKPADIESRWYERWESSGCFIADPKSEREPYTIVIPPPNVTGSLHMGHALTDTIQDVLIRWKRMSGYEALWLPGTDHAGIATQTVVERDLARQGITRQELGRERFLEKVWEWKDRYGDRITFQIRRMGASVDWSRERFTMDEGLSRAVNEVFVRLYEEGLIYREERLVNWDPVAKTVLSDLEVEQEEEDGFLWHIAYPIEGSDETLTVATTRPETLLGDTAVAIHPDDPRYSHLHGKNAVVPISNRLIPIICDAEAADMEFGSGAVKITPAHDFNDFETGRRNNLERIQVIGLDACMLDTCPADYAGLDRSEARRKVLADLEGLGLLVKEEPYRFMPGRSQRSGAIVEPLSVGRQWFVRMQPLAEPAIAAVRDNRIQFVPESWEKTYFHWMENIRDWCISRQLWWGHRVPAWHCDDCGEPTVATTAPECCAHCRSSSLQRDEDVLDTWFSSGLWPFTTLGWPENTDDLKKFYPTTVMETGFDIIFFWVARMIFFGLHFMDEVPFKTVFLHAMVRDKDGHKMSKTKGNVIDPLHLIDGVKAEDLDEQERETYQMLLRDFPEGIAPQGADALRLTLAMYAAAGRDIKLDVKRVEGYKAFVNKLWNAARFTLMNLEGYEPQPLDPSAAQLSPADRWLLTRLHHTTATVESALQDFRFSEAAQALYNFVWHEFCDWYLELTKPVMYASDDDYPGDLNTTRTVLAHTLDIILRLLHPFIPFVTEEIWAAVPVHNRDSEFLATAAWPRAEDIPVFEDDARAVQAVTSIVTGVRRIRGESNLSMGKALPEVMLINDDPSFQASLGAAAGYVRKLARVDKISVHSSDIERPSAAATAVESGTEIIVPLKGLIDVDAERERITKAIAKVDTDIAFFEKKLGNPRFVDNAPAAVIAKDRAKLAEAQEARAALDAGLRRLESV